jgi:hypothetical protein
MPSEHRWCPCCRAERLFEEPCCVDGHDLDCPSPERACVDCGTAIVVGPMLISRPPVRLTVSTAA